MSSSKKRIKGVVDLPALPRAPNENPDCMNVCTIYFNRVEGSFSMMISKDSGADLIMTGLNVLLGQMLGQIFVQMKAMQDKLAGRRIVAPTEAGVRKFGGGH